VLSALLLFFPPPRMSPDKTRYRRIGYVNLPEWFTQYPSDGERLPSSESRRIRYIEDLEDDKQAFAKKHDLRD
jgi:hypothetical protein